MAEIRVERVTREFKSVRAVNDVSITIADGEFMVLLGPSGCGKTTLLRSIAGLEQIDAGRILIGERDVTDLPPRKRDIAMVFQSYAVFPHLTVFENIAFGLRMRKAPKGDIAHRVQKAAELLHIEDLLQRHPAQVSGGQRQRIAVARAIVMEPQVLLMDEPLSNLDALLRLEMRAELKRLLREIKATTIYVTHDQVEALSMGDRIAVMRAGRIIQVGDPLSVYDAPADRFVGGFIGNPPMNFVDAELQPASDGALDAVVAGRGRLRVPSPPAELRAKAGQKVVLGIRAENIEVSPLGEARSGERATAGSAAANGSLPARCLVVEPLGSHNLITVSIGVEQLKATTRPDEQIAPDDEVLLHIDPRRIRWLDPETGQAFPPPPETDAGVRAG